MQGQKSKTVTTVNIGLIRKSRAPLTYGLFLGMIVGGHSPAFAQTTIDLDRVAQQRTIWPSAQSSFPKLSSSDPVAYQKLMASASCRDFVNYSTKQIDQADGFNTDQLVVLKNGKVVFEFFDGDYGPESLHSLWSASKSVSATMVGAAIQSGVYDPSGANLGLHSKLNVFYPSPWRNSIVQNSAGFEQDYDQIDVENLLNMTANFKWLEAYDSELSQSTFLPMLYGWGRSQMASFALMQPMEKWGPGRRFNYSGGNANIMMGLLRQTYGASFKTLPDDLLFSRIGITKSFFEMDASGLFVGASYAYMTPYDLARLGYLYLNNGVWNHQRILPQDWVHDALELTEGLRHVNELAPADQADLRAYVKSEGVYGNRTLWLNHSVEALNYPAEFPHAPSDMFFAAGHYGQLMLVMPTQDLVIARTGHDASYWSKIDDLASKAVSCFSGYGADNSRFRIASKSQHAPLSAGGRP